MVTEKLKELAAARAQLAALEAAVAAEQNGELAALPAQYGFPDAASFVAAVEAATGKGPKRPGRKPKAKAEASGAGRKRRPRVTITDAIRADVKKLAGEDKTGAEIAKTVGISIPSVQNIKKALGLVKKKKKQA